MKRLLEQIVKFGVVGIIATIVDWGIYAVLVPIHGNSSALSDAMHIKTWETICAIISFSVSVIVNYIASMKYVFERRDDMSRLREFAIFLILSIIGLVINIGIIRGLHDIQKVFETWPAFFARFAYMVPKVIATVIVLVWNFVTRKLLLEKRD